MQTMHKREVELHQQFRWNTIRAIQFY